MQGSGFEDIVIEAGICASGSLKKVMSSMEGLNASTRSAIRDLSKAPNEDMYKNVVSLEDLQQLYQGTAAFKNQSEMAV